MQTMLRCRACNPGCRRARCRNSGGPHPPDEGTSISTHAPPVEPTTQSCQGAICSGNRQIAAATPSFNAGRAEDPAEASCGIHGSATGTCKLGTAFAASVAEGTREEVQGCATAVRPCRCDASVACAGQSTSGKCACQGTAPVAPDDGCRRGDQSTISERWAKRQWGLVPSGR